MYRRLARFNKKAPTSNKPSYIVFNPHAGPAPQMLKSDEPYIQITSIDPGIKNCGVRIAKRYLRDGRIEPLLFGRFNFMHDPTTNTSGDEAKVGQDTCYYINSIKALDPYLPQLVDSHYTIIESQLPINYDLVRMGQHLITYLTIQLRDKGSRSLICEIDPHLKSRLLNAPPKMTKPELKKWSANKAKELCQQRNDAFSLKVLNDAKKADDLGDIYIQEEAFWILLNQGAQPVPMPTVRERPKTIIKIVG